MLKISLCCSIGQILNKVVDKIRNSTVNAYSISILPYAPMKLCFLQHCDWNVLLVHEPQDFMEVALSLQQIR